MSTITNAPSVWVGCLAAYNAGRLHGEWIAVPTDPDELRSAIARVLAASPSPGAEEHFFADSEGWGDLDIGEYEDVGRLCRIVADMDGMPRDSSEAYLTFLAHEDGSGSVEAFEEAYAGTWAREEDYASEFIDSMGGWAGVEVESEAWQWMDEDRIYAAILDDCRTYDSHDGRVHVFRD